MTPTEYKAKIDLLLDILHPLPESMQIHVPKHYTEKEIFGDIDILLSYDETGYHALRNRLVAIGVREFFDSLGLDDPNFSIDFSGIQADFIFIPPDAFAFASRYYNYNSLSMAIGVMARHAGFKLTDTALKIPVFSAYAPLEKIDIITASINFDDVLVFLDLCPSTHRNGFLTMNDMHVYLTQSRYFSRHFFTYEYLNNERRRKLKKTRWTKALNHFCIEKRN